MTGTIATINITSEGPAAVPLHTIQNQIKSRGFVFRRIFDSVSRGIFSSYRT